MGYMWSHLALHQAVCPCHVPRCLWQSITVLPYVRHLQAILHAQLHSEIL